MDASIPINSTRRSGLARTQRRRGSGKTKLTLTIDADTAMRLKAHAAIRGLELGVAAGLIMRPWLLRNGAGRSAEEFRASIAIAVDESPNQPDVAEHAA